MDRSGEVIAGVAVSQVATHALTHHVDRRLATEPLQSRNPPHSKNLVESIPSGQVMRSVRPVESAQPVPSEVCAGGWEFRGAITHDMYEGCDLPRFGCDWRESMGRARVCLERLARLSGLRQEF
ncbi:MAG: hypothetical protein DWQ34_06930 [Planctomycetota bacterium]|nr:MAG: hypothetical protein DWQ29_20855 [Planctomycetota bacterium]REJ95085.1 MAG: hypothetical protein DWQ34_06930 [Planctomycetota bacterium]REK21199.1 MAG: hypothetical protein DWQ41_22585 [Planctomycetota bacterium]REK29607.1 MAG: hypothetical protein DWQ45_22620 [Planctomycetota bacterium]